MSEDKFTLDNSSEDILRDAIDEENTKAYANEQEKQEQTDKSLTEFDSDENKQNDTSEQTKASEEEILHIEVETKSSATEVVTKDSVTEIETKDSDNEIETMGSVPEIETMDSDTEKVIDTKKKPKFNIYNAIRIICIIGFIVFTALFINEVVIQPYRIKKSVDLTRELYNKPTKAPAVSSAPTQVPVDVVEETPANNIEVTPTPDPNRDEQGRLLQFKDLLAINDDVKGWITIPNTNVDYVVTQSSKEEPDYYLDKDIKGEYSKAGTLYLDTRSSVESDTQNLVIHGHNMVSTTEKMFHFLLDYKKVSYYKERPILTFDTIYDLGQWKIFAVFITNGSSEKEPLYDFRKSTFKDSSDFLNFVYQMRIRSVLNIDTVDVNENDQILTLSTCSYELDNYRTVIVARRVRDGEDIAVDVDRVTKNKNALYPKSYYYRYGGEAPDIAATFEEAMDKGEIKWYVPMTEKVVE